MSLCDQMAIRSVVLECDPIRGTLAKVASLSSPDLAPVLGLEASSFPCPLLNKTTAPEASGPLGGGGRRDSPQCLWGELLWVAAIKRMQSLEGPWQPTKRTSLRSPHKAVSSLRKRDSCNPQVSPPSLRLLEERGSLGRHFQDVLPCQPVKWGAQHLSRAGGPRGSSSEMTSAPPPPQNHATAVWVKTGGRGDRREGKREELSSEHLPGDRYHASGQCVLDKISDSEI